MLCAACWDSEGIWQDIQEDIRNRPVVCPGKFFAQKRVAVRRTLDLPKAAAIRIGRFPFFVDKKIAPRLMPRGFALLDHF